MKEHSASKQRLTRSDEMEMRLVSELCIVTLHNFFAESPNEFWTLDAHLHNFCVVRCVVITGLLHLISIADIFCLSSLIVSMSIKHWLAVFADFCG